MRCVLIFKTGVLVYVIKGLKVSCYKYDYMWRSVDTPIHKQERCVAEINIVITPCSAAPRYNISETVAYGREY